MACGEPCEPAVTIASVYAYLVGGKLDGSVRALPEAWPVLRVQPAPAISLELVGACDDVDARLELPPVLEYVRDDKPFASVEGQLVHYRYRLREGSS